MTGWVFVAVAAVWLIVSLLVGPIAGRFARGTGREASDLHDPEGMRNENRDRRLGIEREDVQ